MTGQSEGYRQHADTVGGGRAQGTLRSPGGRERIRLALAHREPDRVPRDLGGTVATSMTAVAYHHLQEYLELPGIPVIADPMQHIVEVPEQLRRRFGVDTLNLTPGPSRRVVREEPRGFPILLPERWPDEPEDAGGTILRNTSGQVIARRPAGGYYFDMVNPPLSDVEVPADLGHFRDLIRATDWPIAADESDGALRSRAEALHRTGGFVVLNLSCHLLYAGQALRGYESFMIDLLANPVLAESLLAMLVEGYCSRIDRLADSLKGLVDILMFTDDLGNQDQLTLSPQLYRRRIKPYQETLFAHAKRQFERPILYHSCGAIRLLIPDLIEIGVDALNPVQISARDMDPAGLKRDFGRDITFWGGGVDTQDVLCRRTPAEVKASVKRNVDVLAPGGGFVFCQVHNIQPDVPPENVVAMFEALDEYP